MSSETLARVIIGLLVGIPAVLLLVGAGQALGLDLVVRNWWRRRRVRRLYPNDEKTRLWKRPDDWRDP